LRINKDSAIAVLAITLDSHLFTDVALITEAQLCPGFAYFITLGRKVHIPLRAIEPDPVYFLVLGDFIDHLVDPGAVVFEHLEVSRMENDLAQGFNIVLGILQKDLFQSTDVERSEQRDGNQQDEPRAKDEFTDQAVTERTKLLHQIHLCGR
jgi:hypothetical protein